MPFNYIEVVKKVTQFQEQGIDMTYTSHDQMFVFRRDGKQVCKGMKLDEALAWLDGYQACENDFKMRTGNGE
jgi:hypothetical protein